MKSRFVLNLFSDEHGSESFYYDDIDTITQVYNEFYKNDNYKFIEIQIQHVISLKSVNR